MKNKKADVTDIILFLVIIFIIAIGMIVALYMNTKIKKIIDTTALNQSSAFSSISSRFERINTITVQRGFVLFFGILVIGMLVSAFLIKVHPIFIFLYIITLSASIFTAVYLANVCGKLIKNLKGKIKNEGKLYCSLKCLNKEICQK